MRTPYVLRYPEDGKLALFNPQWPRSYLNAVCVAINSGESGVVRPKLLARHVCGAGMGAAAPVVLWDPDTKTLTPVETMVRLSSRPPVFMSVRLDLDKLPMVEARLVPPVFAPNFLPLVDGEMMGGLFVMPLVPPRLQEVMLDVPRHVWTGLGPEPRPGGRPRGPGMGPSLVLDLELGVGPGTGEDPKTVKGDEPRGPGCPCGLCDTCVTAVASICVCLGGGVCTGVQALGAGCAVAAHGVVMALGAFVSLLGLCAQMVWTGLATLFRGDLFVIANSHARQGIQAFSAVAAIVMFLYTGFTSTTPWVPIVSGLAAHLIPVMFVVRDGRALPCQHHESPDADSINPLLWCYIAMLLAWVVFSTISMATLFGVCTSTGAGLYFLGHVFAMFPLVISAAN